VLAVKSPTTKSGEPRLRWSSFAGGRRGHVAGLGEIPTYTAPTSRSWRRQDRHRARGRRPPTLGARQLLS